MKATRLFALTALSILVATANSLADDKPQPKITGLTVSPATLQLSDIRDSRRLLVQGKTADGKTVDLTAAAKITAGGPQVTIDADGYVVPAKAGDTKVIVSVAGQTIEVPVKVVDVSPKKISFIRDVMPVMSKVGCNAGTCHGSQKGQAGFKLSLRGYDAEYDYAALIDDLSGRRFNRSNPSQSLMLLKPTQGVPHEGGFLFDEESRYYKLIRQWIAEGCRFDTDSRPTRVQLLPEKPVLQHSGDKLQVTVIAHYADGTTRDVSREAIYESSVFEVATVGKNGKIEAVRRGETAVLVRFEGAYAADQVTVLGDREGFAWNDSPIYSDIDKLVNNKLQRMKILPSDLCTDAEFLRRVSFDVIGLPPTAAQLRAFLDDPRDSKTKRTAKIDELLSSPDYVIHWTVKWSDLLLSNRKFITEKGVWGFRNWIRASIASNKPYDKFAHELMTASGSTYENPAANYYRIARDPTIAMENMTQVFIGTRFMCARCHDHPFERWTQQSFYELSAFFSGVGRKKGTVAGEEIIYTLATPIPVKHPKHGGAVSAAFPYTHDAAAKFDKNVNLRKQLADWLTAQQNPYFATSIVNRYWSYFFGRGIIDPVDDIRGSNPPSNPELLAFLTDDFLKHKFDLKHLIRTIVSSHTYQRSYLSNQWNEEDKTNFSHALPRRLTAEQLFDAIMVATGRPHELPGVPAGFRAAQLPDSQAQVSFLDMFGRPPRESPCECERSSEVSLKQTLNLINGPTIADSIIHSKGLIAQLTAEKADNPKVAEEIYISVIGRYPTATEAKAAVEYLAASATPAEGAQDLMWALINSPAFLFNR